MQINKVILSYEEQLKYCMPPLNIEYLINHPEEIINVGQKYLYDYAFRNRVMEYMSLNPVFKARCYDLLGDYIEEYERRQGISHSR